MNDKNTKTKQKNNVNNSFSNLQLSLVLKDLGFCTYSKFLIFYFFEVENFLRFYCKVDG